MTMNRRSPTGRIRISTTGAGLSFHDKQGTTQPAADDDLGSKPTTESATFADASVVNSPVFSRSLSLPAVSLPNPSKAYDVSSEQKTRPIRSDTL